jgi:hypothetical protein
MILFQLRLLYQKDKRDKSNKKLMFCNFLNNVFYEGKAYVINQFVMQPLQNPPLCSITLLVSSIKSLRSSSIMMT